MAEDDEIAAVLKLVTSNKSTTQKLMDLERQQTQNTASSSTEEPQKDLSSLPPHLKAMIMGFVDEKTRNKALRVPKNLLLPPVEFIKNIKDENKLRYLTRSDLEKLDVQGYVIKDGFLQDAGMIQAIRDEVQQMKEMGTLKLAGMNQGQEQWRDKTIRGDLHAWVNDIDQVSLQLPNLGYLLRKMDSIREEMNQVVGFDSPKCQTQVACYPGEGARYVRHLDAFIGGANRRITVLYYLNANWRKEDGGCLRVFLPKPATRPGDEDDEQPLDIEPLGDRILIFQSRTIEHEVLPAHAERFSITTWFY